MIDFSSSGCQLVIHQCLSLAIAFLGGSVLSPGAGIVLAVLVGGVGVLISYLVGQTIRGIAKTALYLYAQEGIGPDAFSDFDFETLGGRVDRGTPTATDYTEGQPVPK